MWNYGHGDGLEKAILLANLLRARHPEQTMSIEVSEGKTTLSANRESYVFSSRKDIGKQTWEIPGKYLV